MTTLPDKTDRKLGLVIDLDTCVGCHACVISCKGWNTENYGAPLADTDAYGADTSGTFLNRVHSYEIQPDDGAAWMVHFPKSCLHCEEAPCVPVCPTGASYKREENGIVLVNEDACIGCGLCAWACPYGARERDPVEKVMKKCTLCIDRIYNDNLPNEDRIPSCVRTCPAGARHFGDLGDPDSNVSRLVETRGGFDLLPEQGTRPVNKYLPPRPKDQLAPKDTAALSRSPIPFPVGWAGWIGRLINCPTERTALVHPAPSIILFTTLSGLGFGLLGLLGLGLPDFSGWMAFGFYAIAFALTCGGLIASVFHLGHPGRALLAALTHLLGILAGRWLFFAEAEHTVGLYYGKRG